MPAARAARSRLIPSSALASASRRLLTRPSRSRRASARSSAGVRPVVIGTATMARLPARYSPAKSWAAPTTGQDFLRPVSDQFGAHAPGVRMDLGGLGPGQRTTAAQALAERLLGMVREGTLAAGGRVPTQRRPAERPGA